MKKLAVLISFFLMLSLISVYAQEAEKKQDAPKPKREMPESKNAPKFNPQADPAKDLEAAIASAKESGKYILLDVGGEWCIWCKRLDIYLYDNAELNKMMKDAFEVVKVNYSQENKNEAFLSNYPKIPGYPHFFILDKNGKFVQSQDTGVLESGGTYSLRKLIAFLTIWGVK